MSDCTHRRVAHTVIATCLFVATAGCGSSATTTQPTSSSPSEPAISTTVSLPVEATSEIASTPAAPPAIPPGKVLAGPQSSCTSSAAAAPIDLRTVEVKVGKVAGRAGESAQVTMTYTGGPPATGTVLWSLLATNPAGSTVQLGYKTLDGQKAGYFYFLFAEGTQHNMDGFADTDTPGEIGMILPQAGLDALGPVWWWSAAVNVDGLDIDFCPDPA
ncbi:hypothetical protein [Rhodococcus erythropolis]|uniref:hypothetical protein n=1 Tax=Rhodococcus erythropolis TaxID=1833 RepID=UPI0021BFDF9D|nr:hypothetical protein [Rhodococcus erythropolis]